MRFTGEERRNVIPVDWISAVTVRLFETPEARGGTYHMAPDDPLMARNMIDWCGEYFKTTGVEFRGADFVPEPVSREDNEDQWMFERMVTENMGTYEPYESTDNTFDMTNMKKFAGDIVCPPIDRTVLHRYIEFGEEDRWGKKRPPKMEKTASAADLLTGLPSGTTASGEILGLDVQGVGGGQWTLSFTGNECKVTRGLPSEDAQILRVQVSDLLALQNGDVSAESLSQNINGAVPEGLLNQLHGVLSRAEQAVSAG